MNDLKTTKARVLAILQQDERARNSDSHLYFRLIGELGQEKGIDMNFVTVTAFLLNMNEWGFPPFESVRRARQKLQQEFPELSANEQVKAFRDEKEAEYREFARGGAL